MTLISTNIAINGQTSYLELAIWQEIFNKLKTRLIKLVNRGKYQPFQVELLYQGFEVMEQLELAYLDQTQTQYNELKKEIERLNRENIQLRKDYYELNKKYWDEIGFYTNLVIQKLEKNNSAL